MNETLIFFLLGLGAFLWFGRFILADWIAGMVFRSGNRYHVDDRVRFADMSGRLTRLGHLALTLETDDRGRVDIPYSRFSGDGMLEKQACGRDCMAFSLTLETDEPFSSIHVRLQTVILSAPWTLISESPNITLKQRSGRACAVDVAVHLIDPSFAVETEAYVRKWMAGEEDPPQ